MPWLRLWNEMPTDPKWRAIGLKSNQQVSPIIAVFVMMLTNASANSQNRGSLDNWSDEDAAAALELEEEAVKAIREAMQGKVLDGDRLTGWKKRQPLREDNSTPRSRKYRERQANARQRIATQRNAPDSDAESETDTESEYESATKEEFILAIDWKPPLIEELPPQFRQLARQWPPGRYDEEAYEFAILGGARKTVAGWCQSWCEYIPVRHRRVMQMTRLSTGDRPGSEFAELLK